ncbi:nucleoside deaminase [Streptomyces gamaensis]|uniref:Nucleoside deaminase n=1 Tax=Streptomyces gamaensis TaxID=1763542 RepID=A0ABW0YVA3_9ACTN
MTSRRRFLRTAAVTAAAAPLPVLAAPAVGAERWSGHWPDRLKEAVVRAVPVAVEWARPARWPFGAVLVDADGGEVVAGARNTSERSGDSTEHAELNLLRQAAAAGYDLSAHVVVSTAEPCPMCAGALVWSGVRGVAYGTSVRGLIGFGVPQIDVSCDLVVRRSLLPHPPALGRGIRTDLTDPLYQNLARHTR